MINTLNSFKIFAINDYIVDFTIEEFDMLCYVVEREVRDSTIEHKRLIAQVVINRVKNKDFPDTIYDVLIQKNQFNSINNYYNPKFYPTVDTITAVYEVLCGDVEDTSQGAVYFYSPAISSQKASNWFEDTREFMFEFEVHRFFKNMEK
jgi:N-acetylmuramoyl-L-alanine amidase